MFNQIETQGTTTNTLVDDYLLTWWPAPTICTSHNVRLIC